VSLFVDDSDAALRIIFGLIERYAYGKPRRPDDCGDIVVANKACWIKKPVTIFNRKSSGA